MTTEPGKLPTRLIDSALRDVLDDVVIRSDLNGYPGRNIREHIAALEAELAACRDDFNKRLDLSARTASTFKAERDQVRAELAEAKKMYGIVLDSRFDTEAENGHLYEALAAFRARAEKAEATLRDALDDANNGRRHMRCIMEDREP